jgi:Na+-driven multidrug efflux pump
MVLLSYYIGVRNKSQISIVVSKSLQYTFVSALIFGGITFVFRWNISRLIFKEPEHQAIMAECLIVGFFHIPIEITSLLLGNLAM